MNNSFPNPEPGDHPQPEVKTVLLRLAVFVLVLFGTHVLLMWLHPLGAHRFFLEFDPWGVVLLGDSSLGAAASQDAVNAVLLCLPLSFSGFLCYSFLRSDVFEKEV